MCLSISLVGDLQGFCKLQYNFLSIVHNLEYAVHADYVHISEYADADGNLIYIIISTYRYLPKMGQSGSVFNYECPKYHYCSFLLVLPILLRKKRGQNHIIFSLKKLIVLLFDAVRCASMRNAH